MFLSNLNGFNSSPLLLNQRFAQRKASSKVWKEKGSKWFGHFFLSLPLWLCITCLFCFLVFESVWFYALFCLTCFRLFVFSFCLFLFFIKKNEKSEKYKNSVCFVYIGTCVPWMAIEIKFSKLCISCNLDEHLNTQLSKWALWLMFVMSTIKWSFILNTHITLFDEND